MAGAAENAGYPLLQQHNHSGRRRENPASAQAGQTGRTAAQHLLAAGDRFEEIAGQEYNF